MDDRATSEAGRHGLGVLRGSALYIGALVGPGLLLAPALAVQVAGAASIVAWAALLAFSAPLALTFAALGVRHPVAGGVSAYVREGLGDAAAAVTGGWFLAAVLLGAPTVSLIGGYYVADLTGSGTAVASVVGLAMLVTVVTANVFGLRVSSGFQLALAAVLVVVMAIALAVALPSRAGDNWTPFTPHGWWAVGTAANILVWLFVGWEAVAQLAGDFRRPAPDLPRAIGLAFAVVTVIYVGLAVATICLTAGTASRVPLADLISVGFGRVGRDATAVLAVALTMGTMNVYLGGAAKLAATLAADRALPAWLAGGGGRSVPRRPLLAIAVIAGTVLLGLLAGVSTTTDLVRATSALFIAVYVLAIVSAIRILDGHARLAAIASLGGILGLAAFSTGFLAVPLIAGAIALVLRRALRPPARAAAPPPPALQRLLFPLLARFVTSARAPSVADAGKASGETPMSRASRSGMPAQQASCDHPQPIDEGVSRTMTTATETPSANHDATQVERGLARPGSSPGKVFAVVALAVFLATLDAFIVNVAFPALQASFAGASLSSVSWVLNVYAIVFAALLVPFGKLGDVVGRRRVFTFGLLAFAAGSALCAAAPSLTLLIVARVLQGAGAAAVTPTSLGLLLPSIPAERRAAAIGAWAAIGAVGAASGPPLGGLLTQISWHWIFIVNVPLALIAALGARRLLPEIRDPVKPPLPDALGTGLLIGAISLLTLGLVKSSDWSWDLRVIGALAAASAIGAAFVRRSSRHPAPVLELSIVRVPAFALASLSAALFFAAFAAMLLSNVIFLNEVWHYSALKAGLALTPGPLAAAAFAPISARLIKRIGPGRVGALGALAFALGSVWWIWKIGLRPDYVGAFLPGMIIGGIGVGLVLPAFSVAATATLAPERLATGIGAQTMFRQIGGTLGVAALVSILGRPAPNEILSAFSHARLFMVATAGIAALALTFIRQRPAVRPAAGGVAPQPAPASAR